MQTLYDEINHRSAETVALLTRLWREPGVSAHGTGLQEMAELLAAEMRELGITTRLEPTETGVSVVYGELPSPGATRTLLIYNHYDVQPAEPLELWTTTPFEPEVRDGPLYARGATDKKGNIVSRLAAIRALLAVHGRVPVSLKFLIEGQEEIGSPGLPGLLDAHRDLLRADGCIWEDTMVRVDAPVVSLGNKGMCKLELRLSCCLLEGSGSLSVQALRV